MLYYILGSCYLEIEREGGAFNMCEVADRLINMGKAEGEDIQQYKTIQNVSVKLGSLEKALDFLDVSAEEYAALQERLKTYANSLDAI